MRGDGVADVCRAAAPGGQQRQPAAAVQRLFERARAPCKRADRLAAPRPADEREQHEQDADPVHDFRGRLHAQGREAEHAHDRPDDEVVVVLRVDERVAGLVARGDLRRATEVAQQVHRQCAVGGPAGRLGLAGQLVMQQFAQFQRDVIALVARQEARNITHVGFDHVVRGHHQVPTPSRKPSTAATWARQASASSPRARLPSAFNR